METTVLEYMGPIIVLRIENDEPDPPAPYQRLDLTDAPDGTLGKRQRGLDQSD